MALNPTHFLKKNFAVTHFLFAFVDKTIFDNLDFFIDVVDDVFGNKIFNKVFNGYLIMKDRADQFRIKDVNRKLYITNGFRFVDVVFKCTLYNRVGIFTSNKSTNIGFLTEQ